MEVNDDRTQTRRLHRRTATPSRKSHDGLWLQARMVGRRHQMPHLPDLDLRLQNGRGRQSVLRTRLRTARTETRRTGRAYLQPIEQLRAEGAPKSRRGEKMEADGEEQGADEGFGIFRGSSAFGWEGMGVAEALDEGVDGANGQGGERRAWDVWAFHKD